MVKVTEKDSAVTFKIRVQPRASKTEVVGEHGDALKIRIASPPVDGKANEEVRKFFARLLDVQTNAVEIIAGDSSRDKVIRVHGVGSRRLLDAVAKMSVARP